MSTSMGVNGALKLIAEREPMLKPSILTMRRQLANNSPVPGLLDMLLRGMALPVWTAAERRRLTEALKTATTHDPAATPPFSRRRMGILHVRFHDAEHAAVHRAAAKAGTTTSAWVRLTLLAACERMGTWDGMSEDKIDGRTRV